MTFQHWQAVSFALLLAGHLLLTSMLPGLGGEIPLLRPFADALLPAQLALFAIGLATLPVSWRGLAARLMLVAALLFCGTVFLTWNSDGALQLQRNVSLIAAGAALCGLIAFNLCGFGLGDPTKAQSRAGLQLSLRGLIITMLVSAFLIWGAKWLRQSEWVSYEHIESSGLSLLFPTTHTLRNSPAVIQSLVGITFGLAAVLVTWGCLGARTILLRLMLCACAIPCAAYCVSWSLFREADWTWLAEWLADYAFIVAASLLSVRWTTWPEWQPTASVVSKKPIRSPMPAAETSTAVSVIAGTTV